MPKAVLLSVQPYYVFLIVAKAMGWDIDIAKTIEVRKSCPTADDWDKTVKIYCSNNKKSFARIPKEYQPLMQPFLGKVVGEFVCDEIYKYTADPFISKQIKEQCTISDDDMVRQSCLSLDDLYYYESHPDTYNWGLLGWHISDLVIYDNPKELSEFHPPCNHADYCTECKNYDFNIKNCRQITRPPQSWCYVEG